MTIAYAILIAALASCGIYLMLSRNIMRIIFGVSVLSAAINLVIFYSGRITSSAPPVVPGTETVLSNDAANPLPQALILTAIVIGFALISYAAALALRLWQSFGTLNSSDLTEAEDLGSPFKKADSR